MDSNHGPSPSKVAKLSDENVSLNVTLLTQPADASTPNESCPEDDPMSGAPLPLPISSSSPKLAGTSSVVPDGSPSSSGPKDITPTSPPPSGSCTCCTGDSLALPEESSSAVAVAEEDGETATHHSELTVELVLEHAFRKMTGKSCDQLYCLLVSLNWHRVHIPLPLWVENSSVMVFGGMPPSPDTETRSIKLRNLIQIEPAFERPFSPVNILGPRDELGFYFYDLNAGSRCRLLPTFWRNCGANLSILRLDAFTCTDLLLFRNILCSRFTPSLEQLLINVDFELGQEHSEVESESTSTTTSTSSSAFKQNLNLQTLTIGLELEKKGEQQFPLEWEQLFNIYPNLVELAFCHGKDNQFQKTELVKILAGVKAVREAVPPTRLQHLTKIDMIVDEDEDYYPGGLSGFCPSIPQLFRDSKLSLTTLALHFDRETSVESVRDLLDSQRTTLTDLSFYRPTPFESNPFVGGTFDKLSRLVLYGFPIANLNYLRNLPNLTSLRLDDTLMGHVSCGDATITKATAEEDMAGVKMLSLEEFHCNYEAFHWDRDDLEKLSRWMPKLRSLALSLTDESFREVSRLWPNLEQLKIVGHGVSDDGIVPHITKFQNLSKFSIGHYIGECRLTPESVNSGFAKLQHSLQEIVITAEKVHPDLEKTLMRLLPECRVLRNLASPKYISNVYYNLGSRQRQQEVSQRSPAEPPLQRYFERMQFEDGQSYNRLFSLAELRKLGEEGREREGWDKS